MNDKQLELFIAIADTGSFTKAEQNQFISKQAIIKQIRNLEEEIGFTLFTRTRHGILLTPEGKLFYDGAKQLLHDKNALILSILEKNHQNILRVGAVQHQVLLQKVTNTFIQQYPEIQLQNVVHPNHSGEFRVEHDIQDVAESFLGDLDPAQLPHEFQPLLKAHYTAIMDPHHPLSDRKSITLEEISQYPLVYFNLMVKQEYRKQLQSLYKHHPDLLQPTNDVDHQVDIMFECLGSQTIILEANPLVKELKGLCCIPLEEDWFRTYGIIYRSNPSFITSLYINLAKKIYAEENR